jgi:anthranilate synthase/aminodeoxychorismate synthase-like glutamine amidotransferase
MKVLIVDCHDSFTYNLYQLAGCLGADPVVVTSDCSIDEIAGIACDRIILSPGSGHPADAGVCQEVVKTLGSEIPVLGVCLGHQVICTAFGGRVTRAHTLMHGKQSAIVHDGSGVFAGIPSPFCAIRYHSLAAEMSSLPPDLTVSAAAVNDGCIMGVRHRRYPVEGVQFHPESILSAAGAEILQNFFSERYGEERP